MPDFAHGKDFHFALGTAASPGTPQDISDSLTEVSVPEEVDTGETTTADGNDARTYIPGLTNATVSLSVKWNPAIEQQLRDLKGVEGVAFEWGPGGNATGDRKLSGSGFVTNYDLTSSVEDPNEGSVELQVSGVVTAGTFA